MNEELWFQEWQWYFENKLYLLGSKDIGRFNDQQGQVGVRFPHINIIFIIPHKKLNQTLTETWRMKKNQREKKTLQSIKAKHKKHLTIFVK